MNIRKLLLAGAAIGCLPMGAASAADMPMKMPVKAPPATPVFSWTGFYVGANVGAIWGDPSETNVQVAPGGGPTVPVDSARYSGVIGGFQAGANYQLPNSALVLGVEGDVDWASAKKSIAIPGGDTYNVDVQMLSTIRARIGLAFDHWLPFVTGGAAFVNLKNEIVDVGVPLGVVNRGNEADGWTFGGGVEYAIDNHWSAKAEYLYVGLPTKNVAASGGGYNYVFTFKDNEQVARVGINYRF